MARITLAAAFRRLFDNEFLTLEAVTISQRSGRHVQYLDQDDALDVMLFDAAPRVMPADPTDETLRLHQALFAADPDAECVISGLSRHLGALLSEGFSPPEATSMMRKRGIPDVSAHLVAADALRGAELAPSVELATDLAARNGMRHLLLVTVDGMVAVAGKPFDEAISHWHNVEFAARVECLGIEEAAIARDRAPSR